MWILLMVVLELPNCTFWHLVNIHWFTTWWRVISVKWVDIQHCILFQLVYVFNINPQIINNTYYIAFLSVCISICFVCLLVLRSVCLSCLAWSLSKGKEEQTKNGIKWKEIIFDFCKSFLCLCSVIGCWQRLRQRQLNLGRQLMWVWGQLRGQEGGR